MEVIEGSISARRLAEYNAEPVYYCKHCKSLKIRYIPGQSDSEYCDDCGSTEIEKASIFEWMEMTNQDINN